MNVSQTRSTLASEGVSVGDVSTLGVRSDPRSPMSVGAIGASTLSMRAKAARKRHVSATHNSNFRAGYIPVEEDALHRAGIRGRKRYFLYCVVTVLFIVALLNAALTAWLLFILGMTHNGMTSLEMTKMEGRNFLRFLDKATIWTMSMIDAPLGAAYDSRLDVEASDEKLELKVNSRSTSESSVILDKGEITIVTDNFAVKTSNATDWFSVSLASLIERENMNLSADEVTVKKISDGRDNVSLSVESDRTLTLKANLGLTVNSSTLGINAGRAAVNLVSQSSITVKSSRIFLGKDLPKVNTSTHEDYKAYKLCVCKSGRLFKVRVDGTNTTCLNADLAQVEKLCGKG